MTDIIKRIAELSPAQRDILSQRLLELSSNKAGASLEPIMQRSRESDSYCLSFAQQRLWFICQLEPDSATYNLSSAVSMRGTFNVAALERSLNETIRRNEILRTSFKLINREPRQV